MPAQLVNGIGRQISTGTKVFTICMDGGGNINGAVSTDVPLLPATGTWVQLAGDGSMPSSCQVAASTS